MNKAIAVVIAVIILIATLYMLYGGEFTSIISRIVQSSSPGTNATAAKTSIYITETTTTRKSVTSTSWTLTKTQYNLSTTSRVITTYPETTTKQVVTSCKVNVTEAGKEFINISTSAEVAQLFSINTKAMLRPEQVFLYVNETYMIAGAKGLIVSLAFYRPESTVPSYEIVPIGEHKPGVILADYVYINNSLTLLAIKLSKVLSTVQAGTYTIIMWSGYESKVIKVLECRAILKETAILLKDTKILEEPIKVACSMSGGEDIASYLTSLICYYNPSTLEEIKSIIYGNLTLQTNQEKIWRALKWVDENIMYDYEKSKAGVKYVNDPLTTIRERKGICTDYSVLLTSALLSANIQPVYILSLEDYLHAAAAVCLDNTVYILDQHLPPIELQDYAEYILGGDLGKIRVIQIRLINGEPTIELFNEVELYLTDYYPEDDTPSNISREVAASIKKSHPNLIPDPRLRSLIDTSILSTKLTIGSPVLAGIKVSTKVPVTAYYSPVFRAQWVEYLTQKTLNLILRYYRNVAENGGYFWVNIRNGSIYLVAVTYRVPDVSLSVEGTNVTIELKSQELLNSINVLLYKPGESKPIAGIAPKGYTYSDIATITAKVWIIRENLAKIVFTSLDVARRVPAGKYVLAVWVNGRISWAMWYVID